MGLCARTENCYVPLCDYNVTSHCIYVCIEDDAVQYCLDTQASQYTCMYTAVQLQLLSELYTVHL